MLWFSATLTVIRLIQQSPVDNQGNVASDLFCKLDFFLGSVVFTLMLVWSSLSLI